MKRTVLALAMLALAGVCHADSLPGPFPSDPVSLGQPPRFRTAWGALAGFNFDQENAAGRVYANVSKRVLGPRLGGFEITERDAGVRETPSRVVSPLCAAFRFSDY